MIGIDRIDTVVFDLDGTLLDTLKDLTDSVNAALEAYGFPARTKDEVRRFVGNGAGRLMALCVPGGEAHPQYRACLEAFKRLYTGNMRRETAPYPGIRPLLLRLSGEKYRLAVVSNKPDAAVKSLCEAYFSDTIRAAFGETPDIPRKPAPDIVRKALQATGSVPERAVCVGDSEVDVETAANAGMAFIGAAWGFRGKQALEQAGAKIIIDHPEELIHILITTIR